MTNILTIEQASRLTSLSVTSIRRRVAAGTLPAMRAGIGKGKLLFHEDQLMRALREEAIANLRDTSDDSKEPTKYTCVNVNEGFSENEKKTPTLKDGKAFFDNPASLGLRVQPKKEVTIC